VSQTVSFAAGAVDTANKTVSIPIVDDALVEGNDTVNVTVSAPTAGPVVAGRPTPSSAFARSAQAERRSLGEGG
jgi:hypothetical protein